MHPDTISCPTIRPIGLQAPVSNKHSVSGRAAPLQGARGAGGAAGSWQRVQQRDASLCCRDYWSIPNIPASNWACQGCAGGAGRVPVASPLLARPPLAAALLTLCTNLRLSTVSVQGSSNMSASMRRASNRESKVPGSHQCGCALGRPLRLPDPLPGPSPWTAASAPGSTPKQRRWAQTERRPMPITCRRRLASVLRPQRQADCQVSAGLAAAAHAVSAAAIQERPCGPPAPPAGSTWRLGALGHAPWLQHRAHGPSLPPCVLPAVNFAQHGSGRQRLRCQGFRPEDGRSVSAAAGSPGSLRHPGGSGGGGN